jgi:hypothetical protein
MKKFSIFILLFLCGGFLFMSCENAAESNETTFTVTIPGTNGATLTLADVYPMYFRPMSGDGELGEPYWFCFGEGGSVTCDKSFSLHTIGYYADEIFVESEQFFLDAGEAFVLKSGEYYVAYGYFDGRISSGYEKTPVASLSFSIVSEDEYKSLLEEPHKGGNNYPISKISKEK